MPKIQKKNQQYSITLPLTLIKKKGWSKGDEVIFKINKEDDFVIMEKI